LVAQPRLQRFTLPNGLQVLHLEDHERPLVRARLHLRIDPSDTPPGRQGLAQLALRMLEHSEAAGLKAEDFDRFLEGSGVQLSACLEPDGLDWRLLTRSRDQDRALGLLADRLLRTVFDPTGLDGQRLACWREEERQEASPQTRLLEALIQAPGSQPTLASLSAISLEDLLTFRARVFRPDRAVLVLHGDLGLEQAKRLVLLSLGTWTAQGTLPAYGPPPIGAPIEATGTPEALLRIPAPGPGWRTQAVALQPSEVSPEAAILLTLLVPGDPALTPVWVGMENNALIATLDAGTWSRLLGKLGALRQRGFIQADLERARAAWEAGRALASLQPSGMLASALSEARDRQVRVTRMKALSLAELNAALSRWLEPTAFRIGAVGAPEALKALGSGLHPEP
jgi:predicted Zn-dependent peptidase